LDDIIDTTTNLYYHSSFGGSVIDCRARLVGRKDKNLCDVNVRGASSSPYDFFRDIFSDDYKIQSVFFTCEDKDGTTHEAEDLHTPSLQQKCHREIG